MKTFSFFYIWEETFKSLAAIKKEAWKYLVLFAFLPLAATALLLFSQSERVSTELRHIVQTMALEQADKSFYHILTPVSAFLWQYILISFLCTYFLSAFYLGLLRMIRESSWSSQPLGLGQAYRRGLSLTFPKGIFLAFLLIALSLEQLIFGSLRILSSFALMAPVLFVNEKSHVFLSLKRALFLGYLPGKAQAINGGLILITFGLLFQAGESFLALITNFIQGLDIWLEIPRSLWATNLSVLPFSLPTLLCTLTTALGYGLMLTFAAFFSSTYYRLASSSDSVGME